VALCGLMIVDRISIRFVVLLVRGPVPCSRQWARLRCAALVPVPTFSVVRGGHVFSRSSVTTPIVAPVFAADLHSTVLVSSRRVLRSAGKACWSDGFGCHVPYPISDSPA
jgi:hypothetical protein